jgi:uncharacterized membrane protein
MRTGSILLPLGFGWITGMRSLAGPTFASVRLRGERHPLHRRGRLERLLGGSASPFVLTALALAEVAADKRPGAPDRTAPPSLAVRALLGAAAGAAIGGASEIVDERRSAWLGALVGASAAVASSYVNLWLRRRAARATGVSEQRLGFAEDALTIGLGTGLARA